MIVCISTNNFKINNLIQIPSQPGRLQIQHMLYGARCRRLQDCVLICFPITQIHISKFIGEKHRKIKYPVAAFYYLTVVVSYINEHKIMDGKIVSLKIK